ncbi:hypothetical protein [Pseudomonas pseudonitroreducens]|uniref:hypothetical protein n=1 Tax=Pseudomonas pseudonitroreducens TaxID=2892326 RepID=UPI001F3DB1F5|nr:hypothetical protein [Pseudomonas pseudonitroreducens]
MKTMLIDSKIEPTTGIHLLRFSKSFLDIPGAAWDVALLIYLFCSSKRCSKVRAALRRKISDLGFLSDLARVVVSGQRRVVTSSNAGAACGAAQAYPVLERVQLQDDPLQCVEINTVRRFGLTEAFPPRSVTKRVRLVGSTFRLGRRSTQAVGGVTPTALVPFESLVAENQQASMRKTSKLAAGWC